MSPTAEMPVLNRVEMAEIKPSESAIHGTREMPRRVFTATAVFDGDQWLAMCPELDIVAEGESAAQAFENLRSAVRESVEVASERGISPGEPAAEDAVLAFLRTHHSIASPVLGQQFTV